MDVQELSQKLMERLFVPLEASGRHVHVTRQQALTLFGHELTEQRPLSQPGQFLSKERLTVVGPKGRFENVAVLGPERNCAQVEISLTDAVHLGLKPPVRPSGKIEATPGCQLLGPQGSVKLNQGVIIAQRHIHMTPEAAELWGVSDGQLVSLRTYTGRPVTFRDLLVRVSPNFATFVHLDYDEANACAMAAGDLGRLLP